MMKRMNILRRALASAAVFTALFWAASVSADQSDKLKPLLVDLKGWQAETAEGAAIDMGGIKMINAVRNYTSGGKSIGATIIVGSNAMIQGQMQSVNVETAESKVTTSELDGFKAVNSYDKNEKSGGIVINILKKDPDGSMFVISYSGMAPDEAWAIVKNFDLKKIKETTKGLLK